MVSSAWHLRNFSAELFKTHLEMEWVTTPPRSFEPVASVGDQKGSVKLHNGTPPGLVVVVVAVCV